MSYKLGSGPVVTIKLSYLLTLPVTHRLGPCWETELRLKRRRISVRASTITLTKVNTARSTFQLWPSDVILGCVVGCLV